MQDRFTFPNYMFYLQQWHEFFILLNVINFLIKARVKVLEAVVSGADDPLEGVDSDLLVVSRGMQNVLDQAERKKKKKKRGPKKWQPFRLGFNILQSRRKYMWVSLWNFS